MRFWKPKAYVIIEFSGREQAFDKEDKDGRMLAIDFETESNRSKEPNKGIFNLYNLAESTRRDIEQNATGIRCYAGYDDNVKLIFSGDVVYVRSPREGAEYVTQIQAGDGYKAFTKSVTSKTYASGTDKQIIIDQMAKDMGLVTKMAKDTIMGVTTGATTFDGRTKDTLDGLLSDNGASYSIQDREIHIATIGKPVDNDAIVLRAETGLIEAPAVTDKGINIRAFLNPDIRPGKLIVVEAITFQDDRTEKPAKKESKKKEAIVNPKQRFADYNGTYIAQAVKFTGNNYTFQEFSVGIEAIRYDS